MKKHAPFLFGLIIVVFLSTYKLTESPPVWMDEGVFTQVARNMALNGEHAVQVAPGEFAHGSYITTSYTVTAPVSASMKLFGVGIFQARIVMVFFIIIAYCAAYALLRRKLSGWTLLTALLLIAFFAPLYGHGKSVLGEIPGVAYLLLSFVFLTRIIEGKRNPREFVLAGLFVMLAMVTKPIFVLIAPALVIALFVYCRELFSSRKEIFVYCAALLVPFIIWILVQFKGDSLTDIVSLYSNPNNVRLGDAVAANIKRFMTEAQPMYTLALFLAWTISGIVRIRRSISWKAGTTPAELIAWAASFITLVMFMKTAGFYRYFFAPEILSLIFVVPSVLSVLSGRYAKAALVGFSLLVVLHAHQTFFGSWIAAYATSTKSAQLEEVIGNLPTDKPIFFYQVPEVVNFLPAGHMNYYQYFVINSFLAIGTEQLPVLETKTPDIVITNGELKDHPAFKGYAVEKTFDRYVIFNKGVIK